MHPVQYHNSYNSAATNLVVINMMFSVFVFNYFNRKPQHRVTQRNNEIIVHSKVSRKNSSVHTGGLGSLS